MKIIAIAVILSATVAYAVATWIYAPPAQNPDVASLTSFDAGLPATERIAALEQAVGQERMARQLLQEEILYLTEALDELTAIAASEPLDRRETRTERETELSREARREMFARRNSPQGRAERLVRAGIDPGLANRIVQREEELQMEALQARYDAGQNHDCQPHYESGHRRVAPVYYGNAQPQHQQNSRQKVEHRLFRQIVPWVGVALDVEHQEVFAKVVPGLIYSVVQRHHREGRGLLEPSEVFVGLYGCELNYRRGNCQGKSRH